MIFAEEYGNNFGIHEIVLLCFATYRKICAGSVYLLTDQHSSKRMWLDWYERAVYTGAVRWNVQKLSRPTFTRRHQFTTWVGRAKALFNQAAQFRQHEWFAPIAWFTEIIWRAELMSLVEHHIFKRTPNILRTPLLMYWSNYCVRKWTMLQTPRSKRLLPSHLDNKVPYNRGGCNDLPHSVTR